MAAAVSPEGAAGGVGGTNVYVAVNTADWLPAASTAMNFSVVVALIVMDAAYCVLAVVGVLPLVV